MSDSENKKELSLLPDFLTLGEGDKVFGYSERADRYGHFDAKLFTGGIRHGNWYGIEWDTEVANPACTRIGSMDLHRLLPIQRRMRRCLLRDDGTVNYYLHPNNSELRDNGAAAVLDGSHGQVMVEIPDMYVRFEAEGTQRCAMMSESPLPGFIKWEKCYISAYEATVDRTTATPLLASVVNMTPEFRGGGQLPAEIANDNIPGRTSLGKPATNVSLSNFRNFARNRGSVAWNCYTYHAHRKLTWLSFVEYANFNNQVGFNPELTESGFRQGGLGVGVTNLRRGVIANGTGVTGLTGGTGSFIPCGITNSLGNRTGIVPYQMPDEYVPDLGAVRDTNVPSYRGVENPFGHLCKWTDGCKVLAQSDADGGLSEFYVCDDPANFASPGAVNHDLRGSITRINGYIREMILGEHGEIMPLSVGGSSNTFFSAGFSAGGTPFPESGVLERGVRFGANAILGASAGFVSSIANASALTAYAHIGTRLCFIPQ